MNPKRVLALILSSPLWLPLFLGGVVWGLFVVFVELANYGFGFLDKERK